MRGKKFCEYCGTDQRNNFERKTDNIMQTGQQTWTEAAPVVKTLLWVWVIMAIVGFVIFGVIAFFIIRSFRDPFPGFEGFRITYIRDIVVGMIGR